MTIEMIHTMEHVCMGMAGLLCFLACFLLFRSTKRGSILRSYREFSGMLKHSSDGSGWYKKAEVSFVKNGVCFHYGKNMTPWKLLFVMAVLGGVGGAVLSGFGMVYGVLGGLFLFALPVILIPYLNKSDNEKMLPELRLVYTALAMQIKAGVFVTDALAECYASVHEPRLKAALLGLAGDIVMQSDLFAALEKFQARFDNRYVDSLCITVLQAMESGKAVELLGDIAEQVKDMEATVLAKKKGKLDRSLTFYQLGMLTSVLGISLYSCITYMLQAAAGL